MNQETNNVEQSEVIKPEVVRYEYAHLTMLCGKCNSKYIVEADVKGGRQFTLPTVSTAQITLSCKDCGNTMSLFYVESTKKDDVESTDSTLDQEPDTAESVETIQE